ncbi:MAG: PKD domain-containing protein, partial [Bacteroidia bacterium]|nr:PKD domain-containing protein [Bacteroidia bacterium]
MSTPGMSACVSDSLGNILFYSNGMKIWDRTNNVMPNGTNLFGKMGATQPVFAVPHIPFDSTYFLFTVGNQGVPSPHYGLHYSKVDLRLNGGFGDVVPGMKNIPVPGGDSAYCALTGIRHYNNRDVWIVVKDQRGSLTYTRYLSYLVSPLGINITPEISSSLVRNISLHGQYGTVIRISQDGTKLFSSDVDPEGKAAEICDFNNITGKVIPLFTFSSTHNSIEYSPNNAEFSMNSNFLYTFEDDTIINSSSLIKQYDLSFSDSTGFMQSEVVLGYGAIGLRLSSDGKIYISASFNGTTVDSFHVINNPTLQGIACNLQKNVFGFNGNIAQRSLPQFLQRYKAYIHSSGNCQNNPVHFSGDIWPPADSIHWDFGDPGSGAANYSNNSTPSHVYELPGQYTVELFVHHIDNRTDTSWKMITIYETPEPDLGPDHTICQGDSATFDAGFCSGCSYEWTSIPPGFSSTEQTITIGQAGIYEVIVTSANGCTGRDTVQLTVTVPPTVTNTPLSKSICSGESTNIPLTSNVPNTDFFWTANGSSPLVTGYSPGTGDTIDQALANSGPGPETVTYTITPTVGSCIGDSVQFVVTITPGDSVLVSITASTNSVCEGTQVSYTATTIQGGSAPNYQWMVNGINQGINNSIFSYSPADNDTVYCILTSSDTVCISNNPATSNEIIMTIYPNLPVSISISTMENPVCEGDTMTFSASTTNKGTLPVFQWFVNGNPVGTNDSTYTYTPSDGGQVYCVLTSGEQCTSNNPTTSDTITMIVNPLVPVGVSISASENPVCEGLPVTFTTAPINGGTIPIYQWRVNGINSGTNNPDFSYTPVDGDLVTCTLTSNAECLTNNPASSNTINMSVGEAPDVSFAVCFDTVTTLNAKPF